MHVIEKYYSKRSKVNKYLIYKIGKSCKNNSYQNNEILYIYLINIPRLVKHFYGIGLDSGVYLFYKKNIKIIWIDKEDLNNLSSLQKDFNLRKSKFFELKNGELVDRTNYYRKN